MAKPVREDYDNPGQFGQALREWEAANPPVVNTGNFTPEQLAAMKTLGDEAAGYSGDTKTADYIRTLQSGQYGFADAQNAANTLIKEGKARNLAERGAEDLFSGSDSIWNRDSSISIAEGGDAGTSLRPGGGDDGGGDDGDDFDRDQTDAFGRLKELLDKLGLGGLTTNVRDLIAKGVLDGDAILFELRNTTEFTTRFAGNAARVKAGFPELRPLVYVALEAQYRETMRANGLGTDFYDEVKDFRALIEGDVSNAELQRRIVNGYRAVSEADPEVIRQMQDLYKITPGQLAQYFLDPGKILPDLERQAAAAAFAARGKEQGKMQLDKLTAEDLVNRGYSEAQAMAAFKILGEQKGLYEEMSGEIALTEKQKVGSAFGFDVDSAEAIKKRATARKNVFAGGGKYSSSTGATSGTTQTGLGIAE